MRKGGGSRAHHCTSVGHETWLCPDVIDRDGARWSACLTQEGEALAVWASMPFTICNKYADLRYAAGARAKREDGPDDPGCRISGWRLGLWLLSSSQRWPRSAANRQDRDLHRIAMGCRHPATGQAAYGLLA